MNFKRVLNRPAIVVAVIVAIISTAVLMNEYYPQVKKSETKYVLKLEPVEPIPSKEEATFLGTVELPPAFGEQDTLHPDAARGAFDDLIPLSVPIWKILLFAAGCFAAVFLIVYVAIIMGNRVMKNIIARIGQISGKISLKIISYFLAVLIFCALLSVPGYWAYYNMRYKVLLVQGLRPILYDSWTNKGTVIPLESEPKTR